jgi:hypothetical protein
MLPFYVSKDRNPNDPACPSILSGVVRRRRTETEASGEVFTKTEALSLPNGRHRANLVKETLLSGGYCFRKRVGI